ncbi:MAG: hypothetical protein ICV62_14710 [Cyanobacteria bacterium Co-bin13]|nr:hypothetical protein [Cyanobacteria bacterium Co-bin13]
MIPAQQPPSAADLLACPKPVSDKLPGSFTPYREALSPWCIVRLLPQMQRITIARFRRRNDADAHMRVLRRLIPQGTYVILFNGAVASSTQAEPRGKGS